MPSKKRPRKRPASLAAQVGSAAMTGTKVFVSSTFFQTLAAMILAIASAWFTIRPTLPDLAPKIGIPKIPKLPFKPSAPGEAIGQIRFGSSGCSATIIGPVDDGDETIDILTAAHCVRLGDTGTMKLKDGRTFAVRCVSRAAQPDVAWLRATRPAGDVPYLLLADVVPPPGSRIWHMGYGIDKPANREEGEVLGVQSDNSQVRYRLSVSPGDSGGGIITTEENKVISPVCCTNRLSGVGTVFGGSPYWVKQLRPTKGTGGTVTPTIYPVIDLSRLAAEEGDSWDFGPSGE